MKRTTFFTAQLTVIILAIHSKTGGKAGEDGIADTKPGDDSS